MPTHILFVQGAGERVHADWDAELVESLDRALGRACPIVYPRMPDEAEPRYDAWKAAIAHELGRLDDGAIVIGHSIGGAVLAHVLAEAPSKWRPRALVLIAAPFLGAGGWHFDEIPPCGDIGARLPEAMQVFVFHGTDDEIVPATHAKFYADAIPRATLRMLARRDHQLGGALDDVAAAIRPLVSVRGDARD